MLADIELRWQDEVYLDALGAQRIPDPTTAGDVCRRFEDAHIERLQAAINEMRLRVWQAQPAAFFDEAIIDADGTLAETTGACKEGMDISYDGLWRYHPSVISSANTQEPLLLVNRSGNRPSSEGAAARLNQARALCETAGFRRITAEFAYQPVACAQPYRMVVVRKNISVEQGLATIRRRRRYRASCDG